jgi:hypothetical protein
MAFRGHTLAETAALTLGGRSAVSVAVTVRETPAVEAIRCSCGAVHPRGRMLPLGTMHVSCDERIELANCPSCGSTVCVGREGLSPSARWRVLPLLR